MILVTGATGNVGRQVVQQLLQAGQPVRALTRRPAEAGLPAGVEVAAGDLGDAASIAAALRGVERAFLFPPLAGGAGPFLEGARGSGLKRVVLLSSAAVGDGPSAQQRNHLAVAHRRVEEALEASGYAWTHVRPGQFATNTLRWAPAIRASGVVRGTYPNAASAPIDPVDIAAVSVRALLDEGYAGRALALSGPESLTQAEQARQIGQALGREVRFESVSVEAARAELLKVIPPPVVETMLALQAAADGKPAPVLPTVQQVTGRPGRTFAQWAQANAAAFR